VALLIIDGQLPEEGGLALSAMLRKRGVTAPILFVASAWQGVETQARLSRLGVHRVLHKPFSAYQFIMEVESTLEAPKAIIRSEAPSELGASSAIPRRLISESALAAIDRPSSA